MANTEAVVEDIEDIEAEVDEETQAASSLHPGARSVDDPKSKAEILKSMIGHFAEMPKTELNDFFNKTMAQFGKGKDWGVGDKSGKNKATLNMKPSAAVGKGGADGAEPMPHLSVKEDIDEMFEDQDLTEEFKERVVTLFEATVGARIIAETLRLEEEYEAKLADAVDEINEELGTKVDSYLDYVVENWMKENEVAIESTLRTELTNEFIEGLKNLFTEHFVEIPEDQVDVVTAMSEKVAELESQLNDAINENAALKEAVAETVQEDVLEAAVAEISVLSSQEKFRKLAEGIEFDGDVDTYTRKLQVIRESYFPEKTAPKETNLITEDFEVEEEKKTVGPDAAVNHYADVISRSVKGGRS